MAADFELAAYQFELPAAQIAQEPPPGRHDSRLMLLDRLTGATALGHFPDLLAELGAGDCLVRNVTRVERARLRGRRVGSGGAVEALLLAPSAAGMVWRALVKPSARLKPGARVAFAGVEAEIGAVLPLGEREVRFASAADLARARAGAGEVPLPPYVRPRGQDPERYQTTYARVPGSVAAPTAGLHFEAEDFARLAGRGALVVDVSLDVGPGTFVPVRSPDIREHRMHAEHFRVEPDAAAALARACRERRRMVALGTTAVRVLETLAARDRWEQGIESETDLFIYPGYAFRMVDALITNFHLPGSSLLMLVAALAGRERVLAAYGRARDEGFRFFSFGDVMWIR